MNMNNNMNKVSLSLSRPLLLLLGLLSGHGGLVTVGASAEGGGSSGGDASAFEVYSIMCS
jgi:hypothetical protein